MIQKVLTMLLPVISWGVIQQILRISSSGLPYFSSALSFRLFIETRNRQTLVGDRVVIYGAGRAGELLLREILNNPRLGVKPVGFVDDDKLKKGKKIQGYPILGPFTEMGRIREQHGVAGILVSFNGPKGSNMASREAVEDFCRKHRLFLKKFRIDLRDVELI